MDLKLVDLHGTVEDFKKWNLRAQLHGEYTGKSWDKMLHFQGTVYKTHTYTLQFQFSIIKDSPKKQ